MIQVQKIRRSVGGAVGGLATIFYMIAGMVSLAVNLAVVVEATGWGFFGVVVGVFFFPVTIVAAPWYALIALGNPIPLAIGYGAFAVAFILAFIGRAVSGEDIE